MRTPGSTYRVQVNRAFPFSKAEALVGYLSSLGVETLYCSPVLRARSGSAHCYDVTDHSLVNPELGGVEGLRSLSSALKKRGMGLLLDIVPNHMSTSSENPYWMDVLEYGEASRYRDMFDVDWRPPRRALLGKVLLPVLSRPLEEEVSAGAISLVLGGAGPVSLRVGESEFPIAPETYRDAFAAIRGAPRSATVGGSLSELDALVPDRWPDSPRSLRQAGEAVKGRLLASIRRKSRFRALEGAGFEVPSADLVRLLSRQHYVLANWADADSLINYRRFLNVNELVALRVEDPVVFEKTHRVISSLLRSGEAMGVRVDHADGLRDPARYFSRLAAAAGGSYILAEKILMTGKRLPRGWDVSGTTGYDFLNAADRVLVDRDKERRVDGVYKRFTGDSTPYTSDVREGKLLAMETMRSESGRLARLLVASYAPNAKPGDLERAVRGVASNFDGYRTYTSGRTRSVRGGARARVIRATSLAETDGAPAEAVRAVKRALLLKGRENLSERRRLNALEFVLRFQQFTAAAAVKGEEDTALYRYVRMTSLNEVGGDPSTFGRGVGEFHRKCSERLRTWPGTMNTTSTHDTKRSEDVRARISVLSEIPESWEDALEEWHALSSRFRSRVAGIQAPTPRDEYLYYQTLLGAWPVTGRSDPSFVKRMLEYMLKAVREERAETSWARPHPEYEKRLEGFVRGTLRSGSPFLPAFRRFEEVVAWYGALNSLSQALLKLTAPGVPDIYQGNETLDFSLVDPDNRRPVDFKARAEMLSKIDGAVAKRGKRAASRASLRGVRTGAAKLYVTALALRFRRDNPALFAAGRYVPVKGAEARRGNIIAYVRKLGGSECLVCVPRLFTELCAPGDVPQGKGSWGETRLLLPRSGPDSYVDVFTGMTLRPESAGGGRSLGAAEVFAEYPVALLSGAARGARP